MPDASPRGSKQNALDGINAAIEVHEEAWSRLGKAIALMRVVGGDPADANRLRARASQRVTFYNRLFHEVQAAATVVSAPTVQQIQATRELVGKVENVAVADAATQAGLQLISDALEQAAGTARAVDFT